MKVILIRHGKTKGNEERRYIGSTDEGLCDSGKNEIMKRKYPEAELIVSSGMKRCTETAEIIYGKREIIVCEEMRECSFGRFENKNYEELKNEEEYIRWIEGGGKSGFPDGEGYEEFCGRCRRGFERIIEENRDKRSIAFIVHGGTIMAVMEKFCNEERDFYDWQIGNGEYIEGYIGGCLKSHLTIRDAQIRR